jgi:hypothetical protein
MSGRWEFDGSAYCLVADKPFEATARNLRETTQDQLAAMLLEHFAIKVVPPFDEMLSRWAHACAYEVRCRAADADDETVFTLKQLVRIAW